MSASGPRRVISQAGLLFAGLLAGIACLAMVPLVALPLGWKEQAIFSAGLILFAMVLNATSRSITITALLMVFSIFSTLRYGYWRVVQTWEGITSAGHIHRWDNIFVVLLLVAEFFAFATLLLGYFQTLRPLKRSPLPLTGKPSDWPSVDVLVPTYNEPLHVVRGTVLAALALDYPADKKRVLLLDDGRRSEFRDFAKQVGVEYVTRDNNAHAKAGNINEALRHTSGELVAIFDCDHVPARSFLKTTLGWFQRDLNLGLLQTPHHFYSPDPFERNLGHFRSVPNEGELFHRLIQDGNDLWNASFFCGSCAVIRRSALNEIGGIAVETVTEDAHTALRLQRRGWNTAYINIPLAAGLATESLAAHIGQRIRWARGMTQILRIENPLFASGLTFSQRLCYLNATTHFLFAIPRLIFLTVPLVYLLFGKVNIYGYTWAILAYALPHLVLSSLTNSRVQGSYRYSFWNEIYEVVLAPYILFPTLLALINPRLGKFNVTSKGGILRRSFFDRRIALPYLLLLALNIAGLVMAERRYVADPVHRDTVIMNGAWCAYSTMILLVASSVAWERRQLRSGACVRAKIPATLQLSSDHRISGDTILISETSVTIKVSEPIELARGTLMSLVLGDRRSHCEIQALVAHSAGTRQDLFLPQLRDDQVRTIDRLAFLHSKSSLRSFKRKDRPLRSFLQIFLLAVKGLVLVPIGLFVPAPQAEDEPIPPGRKSWAASIIVPLVIGGSAFFPHPVHAEGIYSEFPVANGKQAEALPPADFHDQVQLGLASSTRSMSLTGNHASLNFFFNEPVTKVTTEARVNLRYASPYIRNGEARLVFMLNSAEAGSIPLQAGFAQQAEFVLPTDLLTNDNTLSVQLQGTCASCGKSLLWVTIDPTSTINITGTRLPLGNDLSLLPLPFFDRSGEQAAELPFAFAESPDQTTLQSASLIASHFGVLSDVRGIHFPVSVGELPKGNAIVVALRHSKILTTISLPSSHGPLLAMRDNPDDPYGKLLIITGDDSEDLRRAAEVLVTSTWMPHVDSIRVKDTTRIPVLPRYGAPRWLQSSGFSAIGTYTTAERLRLRGTGSLDLYFRLPPDLFLRARQSVPLLLKFQYSGTSEDSRPAVHLRLNGYDVDTIQLKPSVGQSDCSEIVRLPTGSLLPFTNTLTVDFYFQGSSVPNARPLFAVLQGSSLDLQMLPHAVLLPRLELFADAGYPFTEWPDLARTAVIMPRTPGPEDYETLLDFAGFSGAQTGALAARITTTDADHLNEVRDKDLLLIGSTSSQPLLEQWADDMPLGLSGSSLRVNEAPESTLLLHPQWPFRRDDGRRLRSLIAGGVGADLLAESFISPLHGGREVVAIVPATSAAMNATRALFTPNQRQGPVYGGVAVSRNERFTSFLVGTGAYHAGDLNRFQYAAVVLIEDYWLIPLILLLLAFMIVAWVRWSTERVAAERLAAQEI